MVYGYISDGGKQRSRFYIGGITPTPSHSDVLSKFLNNAR